MATEVEICNSALIKLGVEVIVSLSEQSKAARLCNEQYHKIRDKNLEAHFWNFAMKRVSLAIVSADSPPVFGYDLVYQLPSDVLRVLDVNESGNSFKVEQNRYLHTNLSDAKILYISRETDVSKYSSMFKELVAFDLAIDLCMSLTQKRTLRADLKEDKAEFIRDARSADAQEGYMDQIMEDVWLDSRESYGIL
tara:strand:+ start:1533 stop:2114 length:582 start_codon:yes stop_codon:yes gene_type:complete